MMSQSVGNSSQCRSRGYCERIICLWSETVGRGWWHELEDESELLLAAGGRIVEAPLAEAGEVAAAAVREGYRPVLFVPNPADWPRVYDTLGPHRAYAQLFMWSHDDDAMRDLLHFPSAEVQEVVRAKGTLVVPNAAYGRSIDLLFPVSLGDFIPEPMPEGQQNDPIFMYCSRLNPFRIIELNVSSNTTQAALRQYYLIDESTRIPCALPVRAGDDLLVFDSQGHCDLAPAQQPVSLIVQVLRPALWRVESIWKTLMDRLRDVARGFSLSALQQILLINVAPPDTAWLPAKRPPLNTLGMPVRGLGQAESPPYPSPVLVAADGLVSATQDMKPELHLVVRWLPETTKPEFPPTVNVYCDGEELKADWHSKTNWHDDRYPAIAIRSDLGPDPNIRWHWSPGSGASDNGTLDIWLSPAATVEDSPVG